MAYLFGVGVILCLGLAPARWFHKQWEEALPMAVYLLILILYVCGLAGSLRVGVWLILILAALSLLFYLKSSVGQWKACVRQLATPGILVFVLAAGAALVLLRGRLLTQWDEFSHWGLVVRNMMALDRFGNLPQATTYFKGYPPAAALLEYFFARLGGVPLAESYLYRAMDLWLAVMLAASLRRFGWKQWPGVLLQTGLAVLVPFIFYETPYATVYVDALLGVLFASILWSWLTRQGSEEFALLELGLGLCVLCLVKSAGAGLAMFALLIAAAERFWVCRRPLPGTIRGCVLLAVPLLGWLVGKMSWGMYLRATDTEGAWDTSGLTLDGVLGLFRPDVPEYRVSTMQEFKRQLLHPLESGLIRISPAGWAVVLVLAGICIWLLCAKANRRRNAVLFGGLSLSFCVYTLSLLLLYLFTYSEYEARRVASFHRYMGTFLLGFALLTVLALVECSASGRKASLLAPVLALVLVVPAVPAARAAQLLHSRQITAQSVETRAPFVQALNAQARLDQETDRVYFICQNSNGYEYWVTRYNMTPVRLQDAEGWSLGDAYDEGDVWSKAISPEQWQQQLQEQQYTYVYLFRPDERFAQQYGSVFLNPEQIAGGRFYRVVPQADGSVKLDWDQALTESTVTP